MTFMLNSLSRRSCTISMCSIPKKPQRNPKPNAAELSGSKTSDASFNLSFSNEVLNSSKSSDSTGYIPAKTIGFTSSKPSIGAGAGFSTEVIVSPTFTSLASLIPEII